MTIAKTLDANYEYAGFRYIIGAREDGLVIAVPIAGQHPAAGKSRHRRNAVFQYAAEQHTRSMPI